MKFSFVMPVYNDGATVERAVESILDQDVKSVEIILVNDGSTDNSRNVLDTLASKYPDKVKVIHFEENKGACEARNTGAKQAKGEYIAWLPADAKLYPGMLRIWMDALDENPEYDFVYGGYRVTDEQYNPIQGGDFLFQDFDPYVLETSNYIDGSFPMRKSKYDELCKKLKIDGLWDKTVKSLQDWDFWLTVVRDGSKGLYIRDIFFETTMPHKGGLSDDSHNNWLARTKFIKAKQGIPERKTCVASLGAGWHARNVARMIGADFKDMPSFKPHEYHCLYVIGYYPEFATQQDQMFFNDINVPSKGRTAAKKVVHFVGSDVWQLYHCSMLSLKFWREYFKNNVDVLLCEADFIKDELKELGIDNVKVVPIPPVNLYKPSPLPEKFTVAVYTPHTNGEFYHPEQMEEIAKKCPDIHFKFFGNPYRKGIRKDAEGKLTNIEDAGYIKHEEFEDFVKSCSAIVRFPKHDGLPLGVIEFLTAGRYSIQSVPVQYTSFIPISQFTVDGVVSELNRLKTIKEPNLEGSKYWRKEVDHKKYAKTINELCSYQPKEYWENRADKWDVQATDIPWDMEKIVPVLDELKEKLGGKMSIVDMGCGNGKWFPTLSKYGEYHGFDISEKLVKIAKKKHKGSFIVDTVEKSDARNFDVAFCYTTLEHIVDDEFDGAVVNIKKMAKWGVFIEPTNFISRNYCHNHDYKKYFKVVKEVDLGDKTLMVCDLSA